MLKTLLKKFAVDHIASELDIFLHEEIQKVLTDLICNEDTKDLLNEIGADNNDVDSSDDVNRFEMCNVAMVIVLLIICLETVFNFCFSTF